MKKLLMILLGILLIFGIVENVNATTCREIINAWESQGVLDVQINDGNQAIAYIEILMWKQMTYSHKSKISACILKLYNTNTMFFIKMGGHGSYSDMLAAHRKGKLKLYR